MPIDLTAKPICITGASSGIGEATALRCARAGMPVVAAARRLDRLENLVARIEAAGGRARAVQADVTSPDDCERMIGECIDAFGSVYSVFANAGYGMEGPMHEVTDEELRRIFEANFFGTLNSIRPALPRMLEAGEGHVLICSSCIGKFAVPLYGPYCASKAAQWHVGRAMDGELAPRGIRTSSVFPVRTKTEFFDVAVRESRNPSSTRKGQTAKGPFVQNSDTVARAVVRCLRRPKPEVWTSFTVRMIAALYTACPTLVDAGLKRWARKQERDAANGT